MAKIKKWLNKYNENGFINKEHETLEKYLMIGMFISFCIVFLSILGWVIIEI